MTVDPPVARALPPASRARRVSVTLSSGSARDRLTETVDLDATGGPTITSKAEVAPTTPLTDATSVYPDPALSIARSLNIATPVVVLTVVGPNNWPPDGLLPSPTVTLTAVPASRSSFWSSTSTTGCVVKGVPPDAPAGWVRKATAVGTRLGETESQPAKPRAASPRIGPSRRRRRIRSTHIDTNGNRAGGNRQPIAELAFVILAPAEHYATSCDAAGVGLAGRHLSELESANAPRDITGGMRSVA